MDNAETSHPQKTPTGRVSRLDTVLRVTAFVLAIGVIATGSLFGWTIYQERQSALSSTPALRAIADLRVAVEANPADAALRIRLGEALSAAGLQDDAIRQLQAALEITPDHPGAHLDLAVIALGAKQYPQAEGYLKKVIELTEGSQYSSLDKGRETAYFLLGQVSMGEKRWEDAVGYFKAALRIRSDASDTYVALGQALMEMKQDAEAEDALRTALEFDPRYSEARYELGRLFLRNGNVADAAAEFRKAVDTAPEGVDLANRELAKLGPVTDWIDKSRTALSSGDASEAAKAAVVAVSIDPESTTAGRLLATALERSGDKKRAAAAWDEVLRLAPKDAQATAALKRLRAK